jgi:replicative DNA helicase
MDHVSIGNLISESDTADLMMLDPSIVSSDFTFRAHLKTVKESSRKRRLSMLAGKVQDSAKNGDTSKDIAADIILRANEIMAEDNRRGGTNLEDAIAEHDAFVQQLATSEIVPIYLPFPGLGDVILYPGNQAVIGAHTSVGKSAFALHIAIDSALNGQRVLFISAEMTLVEMVQRLASDVCGIGIGLMRQNNTRLTDNPTLESFKAKVRASGGELRIRYMPGATEIEIKQELDAMQAEGGTDLLFVDYVQALTCKAKENTKPYEQIGYLSRWFRKQGADRGMVVMILSQLSRPGKEDRYTNKRPTIWDLKECGNLENDPDVVVLLHKEKTAGYMDWNITAIVAKNRNGNCAEMTYNFDARTAQWK